MGKQGLHNNSAMAFVLLFFIDIDPAKVSNVPLRQEMYLPPSNFLPVENCGKLPAITGGGRLPDKAWVEGQREPRPSAEGVTLDLAAICIHSSSFLTGYSLLHLFIHSWRLWAVAMRGLALTAVSSSCFSLQGLLWLGSRALGTQTSVVAAPRPCCLMAC